MRFSGWNFGTIEEEGVRACRFLAFLGVPPSGFHVAEKGKLIIMSISCMIDMLVISISIIVGISLSRHLCDHAEEIL